MNDPLPMLPQPPPLGEQATTVNVPINEGEYLEMVNHLKATYDEMAEKLFRKDMELMDIKKDLMTAYGVIRLLDNLLEHIAEVPHELTILVEVLRGLLSDSIDNYMFNIKPMSIQ